LGFNTILKLIFAGIILIAISCNYSQVPFGYDVVDVEITSPPDRSEFDEGVPITFSGTATTQSRTSEGTSCTVSRSIYVEAEVTSYSWHSDIDGELGTDSEISIDWLSPGSHVISFIASDNYGSSGIETINIEVIADDVLLITSLTANPNPVTAGEYSTLRANIYYTGREALSYNWITGTGTIPVSNQAEVVWIVPDDTLPGDYEISFTVTDGTLEAFAILTVTVN